MLVECDCCVGVQNTFSAVLDGENRSLVVKRSVVSLLKTK